MRLRGRMGLVLTLALVLITLPALAAGVFQFTDKGVTLHEGETLQTTLKRSGVYDGDGEITYTSSRPGIATVNEDGEITAISKGEAVIYANLIRNDKRVGRAQMNVKVLRGVKDLFAGVHRERGQPRGTITRSSSSS